MYKRMGSSNQLTVFFFFLLQENKTALYWAVEKGNATMVRDILQCNPDTETTTKVKNSKTRVKEIVLLL